MYKRQLLCLRRDVVGPFSLHLSYQLDDIEQMNDRCELSSLLLPSGDAMVGWQTVCLGADDVQKIRHGNSIKGDNSVSENLALAYDVEGELIAVLEGQPEFGCWQPRKVLLSICVLFVSCLM